MLYMVRRPRNSKNGIMYEEMGSRVLTDPYISDKGLKEPTICPACNLVYTKKKWIVNNNLFEKISNEKNYHAVLCPACHKIKDKYPMGVLNLSGQFLQDHKNDVELLLRAEEKRAQERNPLERIMKVDTSKDNNIVIETTTDSLALRLGRALDHAYKGAHKYNFSYGDKFVRVSWERN